MDFVIHSIKVLSVAVYRLFLNVAPIVLMAAIVFGLVRLVAESPAVENVLSVIGVTILSLIVLLFIVLHLLGISDELKRKSKNR